MKKNLFLIVLLFSTQALLAQNTSIGFRGGLNMADLAFENDRQTDWKPGLLLGGFITYSIVGHFGVGADLNFAMRGTQLVNNNNKINLHLNYLEIPIYAKYFFGQAGDKLRPKIMAGPSIALLLSAESDGRDLKDNYEEIDAGIFLAGGFNYRLGGGKWLNIDLRYTHGLTNINANQAGTEIYNRNLALTAGVSFPLGNY